MKGGLLLGFALACVACGTGGTDGGANPGGTGSGSSSSSGAGSSGGSTIDSGGEAEAGLSDGGSTDADFADAGESADADANGTTDAGTKTLQIMPLGDSITYGSHGTNAGYRGFLYNLLQTSPVKFVYVGSSTQTTVTTTVNPLPSTQWHNEGHPSYTINDVSNNLDGLDSTTFVMYGGASRDPNGGHWFDGIASGANARPPLVPDIILMMIGTNDANNSDRTAVHDDLHALITKITTERPDAKLIVAQITPSNRPNNVSYNADVASEVTLFQGSGKHVSMVDMYTNFPQSGLYTDGVHPIDTGYEFMAQQWYDGIAAVVPEVKAH
jgi:hypothetical protein